MTFPMHRPHGFHIPGRLARARTVRGRKTAAVAAGGYTAEKDDGPNCHVVAALSRRELLNRSDEIIAAQ